MIVSALYASTGWDWIKKTFLNSSHLLLYSSSPVLLYSTTHLLCKYTTPLLLYSSIYLLLYLSTPLLLFTSTPLLLSSSALLLHSTKQCKHKTNVTAWHGFHFHKNNLWNIMVKGNYYMLYCSSDTRRTL